MAHPASLTNEDHMKRILVGYQPRLEDRHIETPDTGPISRRYAAFRLNDGVSLAHLDEIRSHRVLGQVAS
jgi:hypothetical protein